MYFAEFCHIFNKFNLKIENSLEKLCNLHGEFLFGAVL